MIVFVNLLKNVEKEREIERAREKHRDGLLGCAGGVVNSVRRVRDRPIGNWGEVATSKWELATVN